MLVKVVVLRSVRDLYLVVSNVFELILTFPLFIVIIRSNMATVVRYRRAQALTWKRLEHTNAQLYFRFS